MLLLALLVGVLVALIHVLGGEATSNNIWEQSKIWPAAASELYSNDDEPSSVRTLDSANYKFEIPENVVTTVPRTAELLTRAQARFQRSLEVASSVGVLEEENKGVRQSDDAQTITGIRLLLDNPDDTQLRYGVDESYEIRIDSWIEVQAVTVYGVMHGMETVKQLLEFGWTVDNDYGTSLSNVFLVRGGAPLTIQDAPVYSYRGIMIDTARHFLPLETLILPNLHVMAANKLNVLHWHMTDKQSWPYQSERYPELSAAGAYCDSCVYTAPDIRRVVQQAADLGIRVVVEFDMPGHTQAVAKSHPEFMSYCNDEPLEPFNVTNPRVDDFVSGLYDEISELFPDGWIHVGGDEVDLDWKECPQTALRQSTSDLQRFELALLDTVISHNKRPVAWQDLLDLGVQLPKEVILDNWKEWIMSQSLAQTTGAGHDVLFSACWYLDHVDESKYATGEGIASPYIWLVNCT